MKHDVTEIVKLVDDRPILVYSYYRSGSTAICDSLATYYNYKNFDEGFHNAFPIRRERFLDYQKTNTNFIVKITGDQWEPRWNDIQTSLWERCCVVRLRRRDFQDQLVSWAISISTHSKWHQLKSDKIEDYKVSIRDHDFKIAYIRMKRANQLIDNCDRRIDYDLFYEDLGIPNTKFVHRKRPINYIELIEKAKTVIKEMR